MKVLVEKKRTEGNCWRKKNWLSQFLFWSPTFHLAINKTVSVMAGNASSIVSCKSPQFARLFLLCEAARTLCLVVLLLTLWSLRKEKGEVRTNVRFSTFCRELTDSVLTSIPSKYPHVLVVSLPDGLLNNVQSLFPTSQKDPGPSLQILCASVVWRGHRLTSRTSRILKTDGIYSYQCPLKASSFSRPRTLKRQKTNTRVLEVQKLSSWSVSCLLFLALLSRLSVPCVC